MMNETQIYVLLLEAARVRIKEYRSEHVCIALSGSAYYYPNYTKHANALIQRIQKLIACPGISPTLTGVDDWLERQGFNVSCRWTKLRKYRLRWIDHMIKQVKEGTFF